MGFNTTILLLNDAITDMEANPEEFVRELVRQIQSDPSGRGRLDNNEIGFGCHANGAQVMPMAHADMPRLYLTQHNLIIELSPRHFRKWGDLKETLRNPHMRSVYLDMLARAERQLVDTREDAMDLLLELAKEDAQRKAETERPTGAQG